MKETANSADDAGTKIEGFGSKLGTFGAAAGALGIGAIFTGIGAKVYDMTSQYSEGMAQIAAKQQERLERN
ncbi:hypothetical protein OVA29_08730 [Exiguobacterium sp. SL14]|nr:hypothetical protein [Exiguobacterium sp. SL14]MCY1690740.1 hypothetical protein [Exiguobacterium sp. SL14]